MQSPLSRAWETLSRYPSLALIPLVWELLTHWPGLLAGRAESAPPGTRTVQLKALLPSGLPSGGKLLGDTFSVSTSGISPGFLGPAAITMLIGLAAAILIALAGAFVTAGYLYLLRLALKNEPPTLNLFWEGLMHFGRRILLFNLIVFGIVLAIMGLALLLGPVALILALVGLVLAVVYILVEFLIIVEDLSLGEALRLAPARLQEHFGQLFPIGLVSLALSALISLTLSGLGLKTIFLAGPLWAWLGTWLALAVILVLLPPPAVETE